MNSMPSLSVDLSSVAPASGPSSEISAFHWLIILGFPPQVAAATAMPDLFTTEEARRSVR
jgi:hypothetical protein